MQDLSKIRNKRGKRAFSPHPTPFLLGSLRAYRAFISPLLPPSCRHFPSCSVYTEEAIRRYGPLRGAWLGAKRLLRCNPLFPGGHDPVP